MNVRITRTTLSLPAALTEKPVPRTTSNRNRPSRLNPRSGFTLVEILIVIAIISLVMSMGLPAITRVTYQRVNSTTRKFIGLFRTVRADAILLNNVYRLAVDLERKTYWVESQREAKLLSNPSEPPPKPNKKGEGPPSNFVFADKYSRKPIPMPDGVAFMGVRKEREGLIKQGIAYIHFFPNGFNDRAILYIGKDGDKEASYSLVLQATSGRATVDNQMVTDFD